VVALALPCLIPTVPHYWPMMMMGGVIYGVCAPFSLEIGEIAKLGLAPLPADGCRGKARPFMLRVMLVLAVWITVWALWPSCILATARNMSIVYFLLGSVVGCGVFLWIVHAFDRD